MIEFLTNWLADAPITAVPYALAALGLIISERSGVLNLTAEGLMLVGALTGVGTCLTLDGYPAVALIAAMAAASFVSLLFAALVVVLRVNQVIAGLSIVFFCQGLTGLVGTHGELAEQAYRGIAPPGDLATFGYSRHWQDLLHAGRHRLSHNPDFLLVNWWLISTMMGLRIRSVGENPAAADAAGISVSLHRVLAIVIGSSLIGLAGGYISVVNVKLWVTGMTGGRGWIAVALVVFARWAPWPALGGALLFGCIEADHPAYRRRRHPRAAIFGDDDSLSGHDRRYDLGRRHAECRHQRARGAWSAPCARGTQLTPLRRGEPMRIYVYGKPQDTREAFEDYLDPAKTAIVSIDMHRGHLDDSPQCPCPAPRARDIVTPIDAFHDGARALGVPIIHVRSVLRRGGVDDIRGISSAWRRTFPLYVGEIPNSDAHAIEGSLWTEFVTRVEPDDLIVETKKRLSAFYPTDLDFLLRNMRVDLSC